MADSMNFFPSSYRNISTLGQHMRLRSGIADLRSRIYEAERQLASGFKSDTHGGLGADATLSQELRQRIARIKTYNDSISLAQSRLTTIQGSLSGIQGDLGSLASLADKAAAPGMPQDIAQAHGSARDVVSGITTLLNSQHANRFIFGGDEVPEPPVTDADTLLNGSGVRAGLREVIANRLAADMGAGPPYTGRLSTSLVGSTVELQHTGGAFGMKLASITRPGAPASVSQPTGTAPNTVTGSVDFGGNPAVDGEKIEIEFELPNGETHTITMVAASPPVPSSAEEDTYYFSTAGDGSADFQTQLNAAIEDVVDRKLTGASAMAAGDDFFDGDVPRIPDTSTSPPVGYVASSTRVVSWYSGETRVPTVDGAAAAPPGSPEKGDTWIVNPGASGAWGGQDGALATWNGNTWEFTRPEEGMRRIDDNGDMRVYQGGVWANSGPAPAQDGPRDDVKSKIDDRLYVSYGVRANEDGPRNSLKMAAVLAAADYDESDPKPYRQIAKEAANGLRQAEDDMIALGSELGVVEERLEITKNRHADMKTLLNNQVMDVEGIDDYEVSVRLQDMVTRLESSYKITSRLSQLSLASFL